MSTHYSRDDVAKYVNGLSHRLTHTGYHVVFGRIGDDGSFIPKEEGDGLFLLMDESGAVLPYGYGDDIDEALEETPEAIIAYAKG